MPDVLRDPIRESLREGVRSRIIHGWYKHSASDGTDRWVICISDPTEEDPSHTISYTYDDKGIKACCQMIDTISQLA